MTAIRALIATAMLAASFSTALADSRVFVAYLYGGNERPAAGDADAYGVATVTITTATQICYSIVLQNAAPLLATPNGAHIHAGAAGVVGGVFVTLPVNALVPTRIGNCIAVPAGNVAAIRANPQNFYVNLHNGAFPGGAARGQLQ